MHAKIEAVFMSELCFVFSQSSVLNSGSVYVFLAEVVKQFNSSSARLHV